MKKALLAMSVLALVGTTAGCSQRQTTTTTRETVQPIAEEPVTIQKRTTTHTEVRTSD